MDIITSNTRTMKTFYEITTLKFQENISTTPKVLDDTFLDMSGSQVS